MTTRLFQFRFVDAEQSWLITFTFFRCQRMKQSAATGILNGLALDYLSTIFLVMGLDITFFVADRCVACSVRHWEPWACLAHCRQFFCSVQVEVSRLKLRIHVARHVPRILSAQSRVLVGILFREFF